MDGVTTEFRVAGRLLLSEKRTDDTLQFHYDTNANLFSVLIGGERYLYVKNIQNDIIGLIDTNGNQVVEYKYDSWGNTVSITGTLAGTVGVKNPFRYRGYYLDAETGLYYLGNRYYDPVIGRFISPDTTEVLTAVPMELRDKNLYAYCDDNPVIRVDKNGNLWEVALAGGGTLGTAISTSVMGSSVASVLGIISPIGWLAIGTFAVIGIVSVGIKYVKEKPKEEKGTKERVTSPIGRRNDYNSRKKAEEAAKKAGGGKEPIKHPKWFHGNKKPHYHPNVEKNYRVTPHAASSHDHYFYPR